MNNKPAGPIRDFFEEAAEDAIEAGCAERCKTGILLKKDGADVIRVPDPHKRRPMVAHKLFRKDN